jgi:hypothetical protein
MAPTRNTSDFRSPESQQALLGDLKTLGLGKAPWTRSAGNLHHARAGRRRTPGFAGDDHSRIPGRHHQNVHELHLAKRSGSSDRAARRGGSRRGLSGSCHSPVPDRISVPTQGPRSPLTDVAAARCAFTRARKDTRDRSRLLILCRSDPGLALFRAPSNPREVGHRLQRQGHDNVVLSRLHGGAERDVPVAFLPRERATDSDRVNVFSAIPRQKKIDGGSRM